MTQRFYADTTKPARVWDNGATGYGNPSPFDCLGPFAKVKNCPVHGTDKRLTCYATGHADTAFSVPACTRHKGRYVRGYFTTGDDGVEFHVMDSHKHISA